MTAESWSHRQFSRANGSNRSVVRRGSALCCLAALHRPPYGGKNNLGIVFRMGASGNGFAQHNLTGVATVVAQPLQEETTMKDKGAEMLQRMLGPSRAKEVRAGWSKLSPDFENFVTNFLVSDVWSRPNLELKIRSLITIAASVALGRVNGLRLHIEMALQNGATKDEIMETILHLAFYAGFPACWDALVIADEVFCRLESAGKKLRTAA